MTEIAGLHIQRVTDWLAVHGVENDGPLTFTKVSGGHSNLTCIVSTQDGRNFVVRRPPLGPVSTGAHNVVREYRLLDALRATSIPIPRALSLCEDSSVTGAPFYVMEWLDGRVIATAEDAESFLPDHEARQRIGSDLVDALVRLHAVEPSEVGLGTRNHPDPIGRLLERIQRTSLEQKTSEIPVVARLRARLTSMKPVTVKIGIVHGDFRLGNVMVDEEGRLIGILDWELYMVNDVLLDVGIFLNSWQEPADGWPQVWMSTPPTLAGGFPTRESMLERYSTLTGSDVSAIAYYRAVAYWRMAIIADGMKARYQGKAMGTAAFDPDHLTGRVEAIARMGIEVLDAM